VKLQPGLISLVIDRYIIELAIQWLKSTYKQTSNTPEHHAESCQHVSVALTHDQSPTATTLTLTMLSLDVSVTTCSWILCTPSQTADSCHSSASTAADVGIHPSQLTKYSHCEESHAFVSFSHLLHFHYTSVLYIKNFNTKLNKGTSTFSYL